MFSLKKLIKTAALSAIMSAVLAGTALAGNVILAPGVNLPASNYQEVGPGAGSQAPAVQTPQEQTAVDNNAQANNAQTTPGVVSAGPGAPSGEAGNTVPETAQAGTPSIWDITPTADPNVFMSRGRAIDVTKPMVALTYDDGPQTEVGNRIMDIFGQYGQKCTFFMVGDRVPSRASEVQRMANEGHEVANHTYSHTYLNKVGAETIRSQVVKCNDIIEQTCGVRPRIMRLPGGNKNETVLKNVNMPIILWNIDTRDWATRNAATTAGSIIGKVKDGDVVLMHELYSSTADATASVVPTLVNQGFQLVTVSEMAALKGIGLENRVYYSF